MLVQINAYKEIIVSSYTGYFQYLWSEITTLHWQNYFYWLIGISLFVWGLEILIPWRKKQPIIRQDFWLDAFYMFFNYFLFSLIGYNALSNVGVQAFKDFLALFGLENSVAINIASWPVWLQFALMFLLADFIQWNTHRLLHRVPLLWEFHKVHHSVKKMGFAAHLRFHWMETIIYKCALFIPFSMIGFSIHDLFFLHIVTTAIGHLNHANIPLTYGPLKYIINNPKMHIWHHAYDLPQCHQYGVNFGISLSLWDYLFSTNYMPNDGRDIELGFENDQNFPKTFWQQVVYPLRFGR